MTAAEHIRWAIRVLTAPATRTGSDDCACDDCSGLRKGARVEVVKELVHALAMVSADGAVTRNPAMFNDPQTGVAVWKKEGEVIHVNDQRVDVGITFHGQEELALTGEEAAALMRGLQHILRKRP